MTAQYLGKNSTRIVEHSRQRVYQAADACAGKALQHRVLLCQRIPLTLHLIELRLQLVNLELLL